MKILITGVNGFIGTALWNHLQARGLGRQTFGVDVKLSRFSPFLSVCDLSDPQRLKKILAWVKPDVIFHLAGGRPAEETLLWQTNFIPTKILLDAVAELKKIRPCIVIPGSAAEYGKVISQKKVSENAPPEPLAWYGFVKYMQTSLGLMYAREGLDVRIARIFNIGGYGTSSMLALGNFAQKIVQMEKRIERRPLLRVGNLSGRRDFLDIEDVCSALWAVAKKGQRGEVYNVCSGNSSSVRLLLRWMIAYSCAQKVRIKEEQKAPSSTFDIVGSNAKLKRVTGWRPRVPLEQSLRNTLQYYRETISKSQRKVG